MKPILVTSYVDPDLDGFACAVAYAEFLNKTDTEAVAGIMGDLHIEAKFVFEKSGAEMPLRLKDAHEFERIVLVDTSNLTMFEGKLLPERVIEVIDHRDVHQAESFSNAKIQIEKVGAAATLVAERFRASGVPISKESAMLLYGAIASNTLNFKSTRATERDKEAFKWLEERAGVNKEFVREMFLAKSDLSGARLKEALWSDYSWYTFGGKTFVFAQLEMIGGRRLVQTRKADILNEIRNIKKKKSANYIFLNIIELAEDGNLLVTEEKEMQMLLSRLFGVSFSGEMASYPGLLLRKDIVLKVKKELEKQRE